MFIHAQTTLLAFLYRGYDVIKGPNALPDSIFDWIISDVVSVWDARQFPKASYLSMASNLVRMSSVNVQVSREYSSTEITMQGAHKSDLWALRDMIIAPDGLKFR